MAFKRSGVRFPLAPPVSARRLTRVGGLLHSCACCSTVAPGSKRGRSPETANVLTACEDDPETNTLVQPPPDPSVCVFPLRVMLIGRGQRLQQLRGNKRV